MRADTVKLKGNVIIRDKKVYVIRKDENDIFKLKGDDNSLFEIKGKHKDGKVILNGNSVIWNHDDKNIWTTDEDKVFTIKSLGKGNNKFFISGDSELDPLFIIDGKEISKKVLDDLEPETIESINVLKGDAAIKLYGDKGKKGVIVITTKKE